MAASQQQCVLAVQGTKTSHVRIKHIEGTNKLNPSPRPLLLFLKQNIVISLSLEGEGGQEAAVANPYISNSHLLSSPSLLTPLVSHSHLVTPLHICPRIEQQLSGAGTPVGGGAHQRRPAKL